MSYTHFLAALAVLQLLDLASTLAVLRAGGREANPLMARAFERLGRVPALLLTKAAVVAAAWHWPLPDPAQWVLLAVYAVVVANNLVVLRRQRRAQP